MTKLRSRRSYQRLDPTNEHAAWARRPGEPLQRATIANRSATGLGLIIGSADPPTSGQTLRIQPRGGYLPLRARVIHTLPLGPDAILLGCRLAAPDPRCDPRTELRRSRRPDHRAG